MNLRRVFLTICVFVILLTPWIIPYAVLYEDIKWDLEHCFPATQGQQIGQYTIIATIDNGRSVPLLANDDGLTFTEVVVDDETIFIRSGEICKYMEEDPPR